MSGANVFLEMYAFAASKIEDECTEMSIGAFANAVAKACTIPRSLQYIRCNGRLMPSIIKILRDVRKNNLDEWPFRGICQ